MKIKPVPKYQHFIPATVALLGSMLSSCDKNSGGGEQVPSGSVPYQAQDEDEQQPIGRYLIPPSPKQAKPESTHPAAPQKTAENP